MKIFIKISIIFCVTSVILGAFGAHSLKNLLSIEQLSSFQTGIRYQMFHGLAILILSLNHDKFTSKLKISLNLMSLGIIFFSFSIYLLSLQNTFNLNLNSLGPITPLGGVFLITSWVLLLFNVKKND
ncbi:MAG: DUF423 domain-containing protein [Flavobacteriales bacterium]|nr:DUF423 domain-containing protein [Flavobacteriales bacterium]